MAGDFCNDTVALGFRRLSIIDLSESACQPLYNEDKTVAVVFNGEIYNFMEIRAELIENGHKLETEGDSEVLVHAYEEYGTDMLKKLRGMFAFVIYDSKNNLLFGTRDIFGIKPHYYYTTEDGDLLFGSEIKAFLEHPKFRKEVNKDALRPYLTFQYSSGEDTFWKGVKKLPPASYYIFKDGKWTDWKVFKKSKSVKKKMKNTFGPDPQVDNFSIKAYCEM
jgi:asparagine synthase (glutamine-hydrolysing)